MSHLPRCVAEVSVSLFYGSLVEPFNTRSGTQKIATHLNALTREVSGVNDGRQSAIDAEKVKFQEN